MTELVLPQPPARDRLRALQIAATAIGGALVAAGVLGLEHHRPVPVAVPHAHARRVARARPRQREPRATAVRPAPAVPQAGDALLSRLAAAGLDRGLFTNSPGGALATAARVAAWRPLIVRAARRSGFDPNEIEGMVFLESAGRADAIAGDDPAAASGLTQIVASTGAGFLHMRVHLGESRRLTYLMWRAEVRGHWRRVHMLAARRRRVDQRFAPAAALRGTVRYLVAARRYLGRDDLAIASYHMGIGNLQGVISRWADSDASTTSIVRRYHLSYAKLYFSSAPDRHARAWRRLTSLDDMTRDYYWKLLAAERLMRLYRHDRSGLATEAMLQTHKNSGEEVLHPLWSTPRFASPHALAAALARGSLVRIPTDSRRTHLVLASSFGQMAYRFHRSRALYRALRPDALAVLLYIGRRVHQLSGSRPLLVTSAVRDLRYQRVLVRHNANATPNYSLHTTGYAFDIARSYGSRREAAAFEFVLERLQALDLIAYIKEPAAIHIAVASHAAARLRALGSSD
jgi:soluble lytic murein transglycosylase-like protein